MYTVLISDLFQEKILEVLYYFPFLIKKSIEIKIKDVGRKYSRGGNGKIKTEK